MNPGLYEYRPPVDLTQARLRKLAAALGPAYVRVSGTWARRPTFLRTMDLCETASGIYGRSDAPAMEGTH